MIELTAIFEFEKMRFENADGDVIIADARIVGFTHFSEYWDGVMKGLNVAKRIIENKSRVKTWALRSVERLYSMGCNRSRPVDFPFQKHLTRNFALDCYRASH